MTKKYRRFTILTIIVLSVTILLAMPGGSYVSAESRSDDCAYFVPSMYVNNVSDPNATSAEPAPGPTALPAAEGIEQGGKIETLIENIADTYAAGDDTWSVFDMVCAGKADKIKNTGRVMADLIDEAYSETSIGGLSKNALAIKALGGDLTKLRTSNGAEFNLIEKLSSFDVSDIKYVSDAVFAMTVYNSGNYAADGGLTREALLEYILASRNSDGIWGYEWGGQSFPDYDSCAMALNALAPYYNAKSAADAGVNEELYSEISSAVNNIVSVLSSVQGDSGTFSASNTDAVVIIGLTSIGVDPASDERFIKNGISVLDGLLSYALADSSGFGYTDSTELNELATEQSFRALTAYKGFKQSKNTPYNIYDIIPINPDSESGGGSGGTGSSGGSGGTGGSGVNVDITVTVTVIGDTPHGEGKHSGAYPIWIAAFKMSAAPEVKASDVLKTVLTENGCTFKGLENGYITSVTNADGVTVSEFTNGKNSGWLYTVNGEAPPVSISSYTLKDGDDVRLYYSDDYTNDSHTGNYSSGTEGSDFDGSAAASPQPEQTPAPTSAAQPEKIDFSDVPESHWAYEYITAMTKRGIINGYEDGTFRPDSNITRAEFAAVLCRADGAEPAAAPETPAFGDVASNDWYAPYVMWAYNAEYVRGYPDGTFMPNDNITREDICVILARLLGGAAAEYTGGSGFSDQSEISDYALSSVMMLKSAGIINGRENNVFAPKDAAARAEAAKMLCALQP